MNRYKTTKQIFEARSEVRVIGRNRGIELETLENMARVRNQNRQCINDLTATGKWARLRRIEAAGMEF